MGHAEYAAGGVDFNQDVNLLYENPEDALKFDPWALYGMKDKKTLVSDFNDHLKKIAKIILMRST